MSTIFSVSFWKDTTERAIKSAAQAALLAIGAGYVNILSLDWSVVGGATLGGAVLSVLTSIVSGALPIGSDGTASLTNAMEPTDTNGTEH